jgi:sigma-54 specific flagellar transcriptional regulator A
MSEAKVLVVDADEQRLETLGAILRFIDYTPVLLTSLSQLSLDGRRQQDWLAIIVGQEDDSGALAGFAEWLKRDRHHPPLLVQSKYHEKLVETLAFDRSACLALEYPVKYVHLSETLKRAGLVRSGDRPAPAAPAAVGGPTGNSALVRRTRRMIEQVAPHDSTVLITGESGTGKEVVARAMRKVRSPAPSPPAAAASRWPRVAPSFSTRSAT